MKLYGQLDTLAAEQPEPAGVEYLRGMVFYQQGKMVEAASAFAKAVAQDPKNLEAMQMRGSKPFSCGQARRSASTARTGT